MMQTSIRNSRITALRLLAQARIGGVVGGARVISTATNHLANQCVVASTCDGQSLLPDNTCRRYFSAGSHSGDNNDDNNPKDDDLRLTEWIPPSRPLAGDKGHSHLYPRNTAAADDDNDDSAQEELEEAELARIEREIKALEENEDATDEDWEKLLADDWVESDEEEEEPAPQPVPQKKMDWLQTRREKLGDDITTDGLTTSYSRPGQDLPVLHHTLLTAEEIMTFLASLGGINPNLVGDKVRNEHGDTRMNGVMKGIIFVSGNSPSHLRMLSNSLVDQLKRRKLQDVGVMGARHGAEGSDDPDETWFCIDCHNYVVNIQDERTRRLLDLETWWSTGNPLAGYGLDSGVDDDEKMDNFVARNPVPFEYGRSDMMDWNSSINQLEHKRWTAPHKTDKRRGRGGGKKKARRR